MAISFLDFIDFRPTDELHRGAENYPSNIDTKGKKAIYDNVGKDAKLTQTIYDTVMFHAQANWRTVDSRRRLLTRQVKAVLPTGIDIDFIMSIITANSEF